MARFIPTSFFSERCPCPMSSAITGEGLADWNAAWEVTLSGRA